jgi:hypothetical protein
MKKSNAFTAYVYIATPTEWGNNKNGHKNGFKIGYTADPTVRNQRLRYKDGYTIRQTFAFEVPSERIGTAVENMAQVEFILKWADIVKPMGDDYFKCSKVTTDKALRHFISIAERAYQKVMG